MPNGIDDYFNLIHQPWGRMFYDILFTQLNLPKEPRLKILDFGSGFGVTSNHYATFHDVTAIEPNTKMSDKRFTENEYCQITGGLGKLADYEDAFFDVVICHNVLEYAENQEEIFTELVRVIKNGGILSIIKHNEIGKITAAAVFDNNPQKALSLLADKDNDHSSTFGNRYLYSNSDLLSWSKRCNLKCKDILGIRAFFALSQNNSIKYDPVWYEKMLELELKVSNIVEYKNIAFFNHLIFKK